MSLLVQQPPVFEKFSVRPVINACGIYTDLGGSVFSPRAWQAMQEINHSFVRMVDLLDRSGEMLASLVGAEAARVIPGASAAITLGTAACIAGRDGPAWEQLPDTSGLKNEVIIQKAHRYKYDRMVRIAGGRLVEAGSENGTTLPELKRAFGPQTAMVLFPAHLERKSGTISLEEVSSVAHAHGIPVFMDAAYMNDPPALMSTFLPRGADLVCFSAKYLTFGRPWKMDRHSIVATVVALEEWLAMDHVARWASYREKVAAMRSLLADTPGIHTEQKYFTMDERLLDDAVNCMTVQCPGGAEQIEQVSADLLSGDPSIATVVLDDKLVVAVDGVLAD